jgi:hypothetical protein
MGNEETNPLESLYLVQLGGHICLKYFAQKRNGQYYPPKSIKLMLSISSEIKKIRFRRILGALLVLYWS